jgi:hypothetical protein
VTSHDAQRTTRQESIAVGKLDLVLLAGDESGPVEFPLQSQLLLSPLRFDLEVLIGNTRIESSRKPIINREKLPEIAPVSMERCL